MEQGYDALKVMESHLEGKDYFVGGQYSIADIALYAYTHVADEGGFDLAGFPSVRGWLERVAAPTRIRSHNSRLEGKDILNRKHIEHYPLCFVRYGLGLIAKQELHF